MSYTEDFCLSSLLDILGGFYRQGKTNPEFVRTLFAAATDDVVNFDDESLPGKLYNGNAKISTGIKNDFNKNYTQQGLMDFLTTIDVTDDAKDKLDSMLNKLIEKNEYDCFGSVEQKVCEMFFGAVQRENRKSKLHNRMLPVKSHSREEGSGEHTESDRIPIRTQNSIRETISILISSAESLEKNGIHILTEIIRALEKECIVIIDSRDRELQYFSLVNQDTINDIIDDKTLRYGTKK